MIKGKMVIHDSTLRSIQSDLENQMVIIRLQQEDGVIREIVIKKVEWMSCVIGMGVILFQISQITGPDINNALIDFFVSQFRSHGEPEWGQNRDMILDAINNGLVFLYRFESSYGGEILIATREVLRLDVGI